MNHTTGMSHTLIVPDFDRKPSAGPEGPPRKSVTAIADIVIRFMNSARKKMPKRMPVYSVWNPPTSSCSASTRSNGGWLVSAIAAMRKITNATMAGAQYHWLTKECQLVHAWPFTIPRVERVCEYRRTPTIASPNAASYEMSCAEARTEPSSGYFEPLDQPASITP